MAANQWNSTLYDRQHAFVWQYGESLLELLAPQAGERILDLGCGTGHLTAKIAQAGAQAVGLDADPTMIATAQHHYPHLSFALADARTFPIDQPFDAVFSNAVLHWIKEPDAVIQRVHQSLRPGGRFVAEFGGLGNVQTIVAALSTVLEDMGVAPWQTYNPWYFPSIADYATRLERHGLAVTFAMLFDRPTLLSDGESGLKHWLTQFASSILAAFAADAQTHIIQQVEEQLRPILYQDGQWTADYRRLRLVAIRD